MSIDKVALIAFAALVAGLVGGYVACRQRDNVEAQHIQARHDRLWEHVQQVRFRLTKVTPDERGEQLARECAFRLGLHPDELP